MRYSVCQLIRKELVTSSNFFLEYCSLVSILFERTNPQCPFFFLENWMLATSSVTRPWAVTYPVDVLNLNYSMIFNKTRKKKEKCKNLSHEKRFFNYHQRLFCITSYLSLNSWIIILFDKANRLERNINRFLFRW